MLAKSMLDKFFSGGGGGERGGGGCFNTGTKVKLDKTRKFVS